MGTEVDARITALLYDPFLPRFRLLKCIAQKGKKFREQRDDPRLAAFVMFRLGAMDGDSSLIPIHIAPAQCEVFARAAEATVPTQPKEQTPLGVRTGIKHLLGIGSCQEVRPLRVALHRAFQIFEGINGDEFAPERDPEELLGDPAATTDGVVA